MILEPICFIAGKIKSALGGDNGNSKTKGYIEHPKVLAEVVKYWNKFSKDKKPSVTEIITHLNSKGLDQAQCYYKYLTDNTSYGKLTKDQKKRLATDSKNRLIQTDKKI